VLAVLWLKRCVVRPRAAAALADPIWPRAKHRVAAAYFCCTLLPRLVPGWAHLLYKLPPWARVLVLSALVILTVGFV